MYIANKSRYEDMMYNRCGKSGLMLPALSLGLWHNFGGVDVAENMKKILFTAFDAGITHFDLANNYGPPAGSAEENFGRILKSDLGAYRDELIISSKAGYRMWPGPYGEWGSRKYIIASADQSLKRMGLDYVDIFYSHRFDPGTPLEETMLALDSLVRHGKALYVGISNYNREQTEAAHKIACELKTPLIIHQPPYNIFHRPYEETGVKDYVYGAGMGMIAFSPLAQGMLTDKYLKGIPDGSRAAKETGALKTDAITPERLQSISRLNEIAQNRGQTLAQMALSWILRDGKVTSVLIGASRAEQITENVMFLGKLDFTPDELAAIDQVSK